jgi:hypothetical protein
VATRRPALGFKPALDDRREVQRSSVPSRRRRSSSA